MTSAIGASLHRAAAMLASLLLGACMTLDTRNNPGYQGPRTYSGVRADLTLVKEAFLSLNIPMMLLFMADTPLCLVADSMLLPLTLREERERRAARALTLTFDREAAGLVRPLAGAPPQENARRLIKACGSFLAQLDPRAAHCFSIDARVHREGGTTQTGRSYKLELAARLDELRQNGGFIAYRDARYILVNEGVEVQTVFVSSIVERAPVRLLVAPGADGDWRVIEAWLPTAPPTD